jgi:endothelin-converting enzyme
LLILGQAGNDNPSKQAIYISPPPTPGLPAPEYYDMHTRSSTHATASLLEDYQTLVEEILEFFLKVPSNDTVSALGQKTRLSLRTTSRRGKIGENVVAFEAKLAAAYPSKEKPDGCSSCYTPMPPTDVAQMLPQLELGLIIGSLAPCGYAPDQVIVVSPAYLKTLSRLLSSTPKETLQAYLVWKAVQEYSSRVEDPKLLPLQAFNSRLRGQEVRSDKNRHKVCLQSVDDDLHYALSSLFLEMGVKDDYPGFGRVLASEVHNRYVELLQEADWMSEDVRESTIEMVSSHYAA